MRDTFRVPVHDMLELGGLLNARIIAGAAGQDRAVTGLSIVEAPDAVDWVRPHTLVMTGGFPLQHLSGSPGDASGLVGFISQLDDLDVAGLAIRFGPHLDSLPPEVAAAADDLGFPIIELPTEVPFDLLFGQTMADVTSVQAGVLQRSSHLHAALEALLLEGADLSRIAEQASRVLGLAVTITSTDGREMASALTDEERALLAEADLFDDTGRLRTERLRLQVIRSGEGEILAQPVVAAGSDLARIIAFNPDRPIAADVRYALERAAGVVALLITQRQALNAVENKYRGDFIRDVLSGRAKDREHSEEYATGLGWRLDMPCIVVSAQLEPQGPREQPAPTRVRRSWQSRFYTAWSQVVGRESRSYPCADFSDEVVAIIALPDPDREGAVDPAEATMRLQQIVERIVRHVSGDRGGGRRPFAVGTSRLVTSFEEFPAAYQQARRATEVGRRFAGRNSLSHFDDLGIHRLLGLITDDAEMSTFAHDVLGELAGETPEAVDLRNTLRVLLENNLNVAEASRLLTIHYNTMRYRITKLERIVGPFTSNSALRLNLAVALEVHRIGG